MIVSGAVPLFDKISEIGPDPDALCPVMFAPTAEVDQLKLVPVTVPAGVKLSWSPEQISSVPPLVKVGSGWIVTITSVVGPVQTVLLFADGVTV